MKKVTDPSSPSERKSLTAAYTTRTAQGKFHVTSRGFRDIPSTPSHLWYLSPLLCIYYVIYLCYYLLHPLSRAGFLIKIVRVSNNSFVVFVHRSVDSYWYGMREESKHQKIVSPVFIYAFRCLFRSPSCLSRVTLRSRVELLYLLATWLLREREVRQCFTSCSIEIFTARVGYVSCLISVRKAALPPLCLIQASGTSGANVFCLFLRKSCSVASASFGSNCPYFTTQSHCLGLSFINLIQLFVDVMSDCVFVKHNNFFIP